MITLVIVIVDMMFNSCAFLFFFTRHGLLLTKMWLFLTCFHLQFLLVLHLHFFQPFCQQPE